MRECEGLEMQDPDLLVVSTFLSTPLVDVRFLDSDCPQGNEILSLLYTNTKYIQE